MPRDISGIRLAKLLAQLDYSVSHQTGSHIRMTTQRDGEHHVTIPAHDSLHIGTLHAILSDIAVHHSLSREELLDKLF
jgi:predicted RNA binding protein YcfA (HicA-like mRNA interferase family)